MTILYVIGALLALTLGFMLFVSVFVLFSAVITGIYYKIILKIAGPSATALIQAAKIKNDP